jgi:hypothetical protein
VVHIYERCLGMARVWRRATGVYQLQPPQTTIIVNASAGPLNNHDCGVVTCTAFPRPRQPVPAPASCDTSLGISESALQMKFGSVNGIRSSLRGRAWSEKGGKGPGRKKRRQKENCGGRRRKCITYPLDALVRGFPPARLAHDERRRRRE